MYAATASRYSVWTLHILADRLLRGHIRAGRTHLVAD